MAGLSSIRTHGDKIEIVNQLLLPHTTVFLEIKSIQDAHDAIKTMKVRIEIRRFYLIPSACTLNAGHRFVGLPRSLRWQRCRSPHTLPRRCKRLHGRSSLDQLLLYKLTLCPSLTSSLLPVRQRSTLALQLAVCQSYFRQQLKQGRTRYLPRWTSSPREEEFQMKMWVETRQCPSGEATG
jgi:hypothetical protein